MRMGGRHSINLGKATKNRHWNVSQKWKERAVQELGWIKENMDRYNSRFLRQEEGVQLECVYGKRNSRETESSG
jgi:hypothetical protein